MMKSTEPTTNSDEITDAIRLVSSMIKGQDEPFHIILPMDTYTYERIMNAEPEDAYTGPWIDSEGKTLSGSRREVKITAHIRQNATAEVRRYDTWGVVGDEDEAWPLISFWEDGDYSCDCNREICFDRAHGVDGCDDSECTDGRFSVNLENPSTGEVFYREFPT